MPPVARPIQTIPPLMFAIVWNVFTAVHAFFMLGAAWGTSTMFFLVPFYAVFFGVGIWMAYAWLRWQKMLRQFGTPQIRQLPSVIPGQTIQLALEFDRLWSRHATLIATLRWVAVDSDGDSIDTLAEQTLSGSALPGTSSTVWQGMAVVPHLLDNSQRSRLELHVQPQTGKPGQGWRFVLPVQEAAAIVQKMSPEQTQQADKVLKWVMVILLLMGAGLLVSALASRHFSLFRLLFPCGFFLGAYFCRGVRHSLSTLATSPTGDALASHHPEAMRTQPFVKRTRSLVSVFGVLMFAAFAFDAFMPEAFGTLLDSSVARYVRPVLGMKRPSQTIDFQLPTHMFHGDGSVVAIQVRGSGRLQGDALTLTLDELRITEFQPYPGRDARMPADKIVITAVSDAGDHVSTWGQTPALALPALNAERTYVLTNVETQLKLSPQADLGQIWLRIELWYGDSYAPLDAPAGHLARLFAATDPQFDTCQSGGAFLMSPRDAIRQHCSERLAKALRNPWWMLVGKYQVWRGHDPLFMEAYQQHDLAAVGVLHQAGVPVDTLDSTNRTALMLAAWQGDEEFVRALLAAGANPVYRAAPETHSALSGALYDSTVNTARILLQDIRLLDAQALAFGYYPVHFVANNGQVESLRLLLDAGVDVNAVNTGRGGRGETLLMAATRSQQHSVAMIALLLTRGAQLDALDRHGKNATDWAEFFGNQAASDALCRHGLEPTPLDRSGNNNEVRKRASCAQPSAAALSPADA